MISCVHYPDLTDLTQLSLGILCLEIEAGIYDTTAFQTASVANDETMR